MALTQEDILAIGQLLDTKLEPINERLDKVDERFDKVDERFDKVDERFNKVEKQIRRTERNLKAEIVESENLILQEVDDVHKLLDKH